MSYLRQWAFRGKKERERGREREREREGGREGETPTSRVENYASPQKSAFVTRFISRSRFRASSMILNKTNQMHISFKIIKFYFTLCCSTSFGHHCVHHRELLIAAHAVSGHSVVLGRLLLLSSNNRTRLEETTDTTPTPKLT
jgi:hypothetical protein